MSEDEERRIEIESNSRTLTNYLIRSIKNMMSKESLQNKIPMNFLKFSKVAWRAHGICHKNLSLLGHLSGPIVGYIEYAET